MSKIRDNELKRLKLYAKSLGIKTVVKKHKKGDPDASWTDGNPKVITLYKARSDTKTSLVIYLVHEISHHLEHVHNEDRNNEDLRQALIAEDERDEKKDLPLIKELRKLIYEDELKASHYQMKIVKELDIRIKYVTIRLNMMLDLYHYRTYYEIGEYPTSTQMRQKRKEFKAQLAKESKK